MKKTKVVIGLCLFVSSLGLSAQQSMTLRDCMEYALRHSTEKEIQRANNNDALVQRREAILKAFTPNVSAGTNAYTNWGRTIDPETNSYISMTSFSNSYSVNAGIVLFDGFSALNNIKIAKTAVKMGLSQEQKLNDEICLSVMQAYFNVLFQSEMGEALLAQVNTGKENLTLLKKQYDLGQKGYADVAQVEADLAEREYQLVNVQNQKEEALLNLKALMLWSVDDTLMLQTSVAEIRPMADIASTSSLDLMEYAKNYQPSALLAKGKMEQTQYALRAAKGQFLPHLSLNGGWSTSFYTYPGKEDYKAPSFSTQFRNNGGEYVQISLSIPIFDQLSRHSYLQRKKNDYRRATAEYNQTLKAIENEVSRALQDSRGAQAAHRQAEKRLKAQTEAYRLNVRKFAEGLISPIEYQTVSNAYLDAKAQCLNAFLQLQLKTSVVNFYKGISYLEQQK